MLKKQVAQQQIAEKQIEIPQLQRKEQPLASILLSIQSILQSLAIPLCALAFVLCVLLSLTPLYRKPDAVIQLGTFLGIQLAQISSWLPKNIGFATDPLGSQIDTSIIEFLLLIALEFIIYGISTLIIKRQPAQNENRSVMHFIWLGAVVAGCIYILTPGNLSHDIIVYASYGRLIAIYHTNPYFVPLSTYPNDPLALLNYWFNATSAYGPLWLLICAFWGFVLNPQPVPYFLAFRAFALAAHLCNIWLVSAILRKMEYSPRAVTLGTLLYAWNPLVLFESANGGHNDIFMLTFILLGILLSIRAEERGFTHPRNYLPLLIVFTLAALVKFTIIPIIIFFILTLAFKALRLASSTQLTMNGENMLHALRLHWRSALYPALSAGGATILTVLLFYGPFWISHDILDIIGSITSPPSASSAQFSIQRALIEWYNSSFSSPDSGGNIILQLFLSHDTWSHINIAAITISLLLGTIWLWHRPTTRTIVLATLASLCILLIVTPWFYSWYVIWLVGLAVICLPAASERIERALVAFALTFSISAFATYLYLYGYPPFGTWTGFVCLTTIGPPLLAALIFMVPWRTRGRTTSNTSRKRRLLHFKN